MHNLAMILQFIRGREPLAALGTRITDSFMFIHVFIIVAFTSKTLLTFTAPILEVAGVFLHVTL